jgi:hypothetical protein
MGSCAEQGWNWKKEYYGGFLQRGQPGRHDTTQTLSTTVRQEARLPLTQCQRLFLSGSSKGENMFEQLIGKKVKWVPVANNDGESNTEVLEIISIGGHLALVNPVTPRPGDKRLVPFQARTSDLILVDEDVLLANFMSYEISEKLDAIERAAGKALASNNNPCGLVVDYLPGEALPWRLADNWYVKHFESVEEACEATRTWYENHQAY